MTRLCSKCRTEKPVEDFHFHYGKPRSECKSCSKEEARRWRENNREKHNALHRKLYWRNRDRILTRQRQEGLLVKKEVLAYYGNGICACTKCGYLDVRALTLDHVNNDGAEQRKLGQRTGIALYYNLRKKGYPRGYQTLCMNCQIIKI